MWLNVHSTMSRPSSRNSIVQMGLELVAQLGSRFSPSETERSVTDFGDQRNQAGGQGQQGSGKVRCRQACDTRSMVHRGVLSRCGTEFGRPCYLKERAPRFQVVRQPTWPTQARLESKTIGNWLNSAALTRSHPIQVSDGRRAPLVPAPPGRPPGNSSLEKMLAYLVSSGNGTAGSRSARDRSTGCTSSHRMTSTVTPPIVFRSAKGFSAMENSFRGAKDYGLESRSPCEIMRSS